MKIGFIGMLFLTLLVLKFTGVVTFSWGWVFGIPAIVVVGVVTIFALLCVIIAKIGWSK